MEGKVGMRKGKKSKGKKLEKWKNKRGQKFESPLSRG
jgi:hypothetical protein